MTVSFSFIYLRVCVCVCGNIQLKKYFTFEVMVLDDKNVRRRFRASNYQSTTRVKVKKNTFPKSLTTMTNLILYHSSSMILVAFHLYNAHEIRRGLESNTGKDRSRVMGDLLTVPSY